MLIDPIAFDETASLVAPAGLLEIAASRDGRLVGVVCTGHESLALIDVGTTTDGLAWTPSPSTGAQD